MAATVLEKYTLDGKAQSVQGYKFIAWNVSATQLFSVFTGFALSAAISEDGGVFTNETTAANNDTTNDVTLMPTPTAVNDRFYVGYSDTFDEVEINVSTAGAGTYTLTWEYSRGSGDWGSLTVTDDTSSFKTSGINTVSFTPPDDWRTDTVNSQGPFYYIRAVKGSGTQTTQPLGQRLYIDPGRIAQQTVETQSHSVTGFATTTTTRLPIKLRTVLYGYDFEQRILNITEATSQDFFPAVNANIVDSLSTVTARTGITISHAGDSVTLDGTGISPVNTTQKLYDRLQYEGFNVPQEPFVDLMATVDGQNFNPFEYDLIVSGFLFDGESKSIAFATGKDLTISASGGDVQDLSVTGDVVTGTGFDRTTFDNLDVTGDVDLTNAGAGTYTVLDCTWGSVSSSVSGITLNLSGDSSITTNNDPGNITIQNTKIFTVTGLDTGSRVIWLTRPGETELENKLESGGTASYTYNYTVDTDIWVQILSTTKFNELREAQLLNQDQTLIAGQRNDPFYSNP